VAGQEEIKDNSERHFFERIMANIGDITGPIALVITLLWWFGVTPQRITKWTKEHQVWSKIIFVIPILAVAFGIFDAAYHFVVDPYGLGQNRWSYGGAWILMSFIFATFIAERYIKRDGIGYNLLLIGRLLFIPTACILFTIGLNISIKDTLIWFGIFAGVALVVFGTIFLLARAGKKDRFNK
jgi:drug/metabolite transporter superfamily protein YnfA